MKKPTDGKQAGFTLMEMLAVVAIVAALALIVIPSVMQIRSVLTCRENQRIARSCFLAVQEQVTELYGLGQLDAWGSSAVAQQGDETGIPPKGCLYISSRDEETGAILFSSIIRDLLGSGTAVAEYDPRTGNVYGVFYHHNGADLEEQYAMGQLSRDTEMQKQLQLGYYDGGSVNRGLWDTEPVQAELCILNGQECTLEIVIPCPVEDVPGFLERLQVTVTLTGESGGRICRALSQLKLGQDGVRWSAYGESKVQIPLTLDSLWEGGSFAAMSSGTDPRYVVSEREFAILPGENVTVRVDAVYRNGPGQPYLTIKSRARAGVNPLFASLTENSSGRYVIEIANGRHLQNLNAIAPSLAEKVDTVVFRTEDGNADASGKVTGGVLDWQKTSDYYKGLSFVPIRNPKLFGDVSLAQFPVVTDSGIRSRYAQVLGNGVRIQNLHITEESCQGHYPGYTGVEAEAVCAAGLFGYVNGKIDNLHLVNPVIRGAMGQKLSAASALAGIAGPDTRISGCSAYLDTQAQDYAPDKLDMENFSGGEGAYGISGYGAVGGLVGLFHGENPNTDTVINSFAAVPVYGMTQDRVDGGYIQGVGGLVGNARLIRFRKCYASGFASGAGCRAANESFSVTDFTVRASDSWGAGGFVGTEQGCCFTNCFASGTVKGSVAGGFVGVMCYDAGTGHSVFYRCYSLGLSLEDGQVLETFSGAQGLLEDRSDLRIGFAGDFYQAAIADYLQQGVMDPVDYIYRDCGYLSGNYPNADYKYGPEICAVPMSYETLLHLPQPSADALAALKATPFRSEEALESAKTILRSLRAEESRLEAVLARYGGTGSMQIWFDALAYLDAPQDLEKRLTSRYAAAFPAGIWGAAGKTVCYTQESAGSYPFPMLTGLPYYGNWPEKKEFSGDYGILYYERYGDADGVHLVSLADGRVSECGLDLSRVAVETGYALYFPAETKPFAKDTYQRIGAEIPGLGAGLPENFRICEIQTPAGVSGAGKPETVTVSSRNGKHSAIFLPGFADSIGQTESVYRIRSQAHLEQAARFPDQNFLLSGVIRLDETYAPIPLFAGSMSGDADSCIQVAAGNCGLVEVLEGSLEGIRVEGIYTLNGVAGILCHKMEAGAVIRDCHVKGTITWENSQAIGGIVGRMEGGLLTGVTAVMQFSQADTPAVGLILGYGQNGTVQNCWAETNHNEVPFAGGAAVAATQSVSAATHMGGREIADGLLSAEEAAELWETVTEKQTYSVSFTDCRVIRNGQSSPIPMPVYYYRLTPVGGWKITECDRIPESGVCILITEDAEVLQAWNGQIRTSVWPEGTEPLPAFFWSAGEIWQSETDSATLQVVWEDGGALAVYEETVTSEVVTYLADGTEVREKRIRQQRKTLPCRVYLVTENRDSRLQLLDQGSVLQ